MRFLFKILLRLYVCVPPSPFRCFSVSMCVYIEAKGAVCVPLPFSSFVVGTLDSFRTHTSLTKVCLCRLRCRRRRLIKVLPTAFTPCT